MRALWLLLSLLCLPTLAGAESAASLRSPLPASHVLDPGGLLAADTRRELDRLAGTLDAANQGEVAFVVISSTDGADPRAFATAVFNRWGVGHRGRDNGTLLLLARADRAAEIVLGNGIDNARNRAHAQAVMDQEMVPRFRQGDYDQALVAGTNALLTRIYGVDLSRPAEQPVDPAASASSDTQPAGLLAADDRSTTAPAPVAQTTPTNRGGPGLSDNSAIAIGLSFFAAVFGFVGWVLVKLTRLIWWFSGSAWFSRKCARCSSKMDMLGEVADDAHLAPAELTEEKLRSVDHRVYVCPRCRHVDKLSRRAWFTRYSDCSACHSRALSSVSKTITAATRWSTGLAEVTSTCQHCGKVEVTQKTLPTLPAPSSSSSSSSSYGGGRSSGGGASGRW